MHKSRLSEWFDLSGWSGWVVQMIRVVRAVRGVPVVRWLGGQVFR